MDHEEFEQILEDQIAKIRSSLGAKAREYATDGDRMHNFKVSAAFKGETPEQALWGFQVKHLVSIRDMVKSGNSYPEAVWDEKLGDAINYFILLRAVIVETGKDLSLPNHLEGSDIIDVHAAESPMRVQLFREGPQDNHQKFGVELQNGSDSSPVLHPIDTD